jgi:hypothetical protein
LRYWFAAILIFSPNILPAVPFSLKCKEPGVPFCIQYPRGEAFKSQSELDSCRQTLQLYVKDFENWQKCLIHELVDYSEEKQRGIFNKFNCLAEGGPLC